VDDLAAQHLEPSLRGLTLRRQWQFRGHVNEQQKCLLHQAWQILFVHAKHGTCVGAAPFKVLDLVLRIVIVVASIVSIVVPNVESPCEEVFEHTEPMKHMGHERFSAVRDAARLEGE